MPSSVAWPFRASASREGTDMLRYRDAVTLPALLSAPAASPPPGGGDRSDSRQTPPPRRAEGVGAAAIAPDSAHPCKAAPTPGASSSPLQGEGSHFSFLL